MSEKIRVTADNIVVHFKNDQARELYAEICNLRNALRDAYEYSSTSPAIAPETPMLDAVQKTLGFDE